MRKTLIVWCRLSVPFRLYGLRADSRSVWASTVAARVPLTRERADAGSAITGVAATRAARAEEASSPLQLSKVRQQRGALVHCDEPAIDDETVRRQNRRQIRRWIQTSCSPEQGVIVIQYLLERRRGVVVEVRGGPADPAQLCDFHHA